MPYTAEDIGKVPSTEVFEARLKIREMGGSTTATEDRVIKMAVKGQLTLDPRIDRFSSIVGTQPEPRLQQTPAPERNAQARIDAFTSVKLVDLGGRGIPGEIRARRHLAWNFH